MNSCSPIAASLPGSAPHRAVTTCSAASQVTDSSGRAQVSVTVGHATEQGVPDPLRQRGRRGDQLGPEPSQVPQVRPDLIQLLRDIAMQLDRQPGDHHAIGLISLMPREVLLLTGDMGDQRLDAYQRQPPLRAQPLHLQLPRPGRLARHRHLPNPFARACATAQSSAAPSRNAFTRTVLRASTGTS